MPESLQQPCRLSGAGVLVTRAAHQADHLCRLIERSGGRALRFPALEIAGPSDPARARAQLAQIEQYDLAVFVSPNAVACTMPLLADGLPRSLRVAALGRASAAALRAAGRAADIVPEGRYDSETLLAMPELAAMDGRRVIIFRGDGGRPLLGESLRQRGAEVHYVEVYRRLCPRVDAAPLLRRWRDQVDLVSVTSNTILDNLHAMLGADGQQLLRATPLLVLSQRQRQRARELGCDQVIVARRADDQAIVDAACVWRGAHAG